MTTIVTLTTGLPASGKTTLAYELVEKGARRVNLDDLRRMLDFNEGDKRLSQEHENTVLDIQDAAVLALVNDGFDVVVDNTHLTQRIPKRLRKLLGSRVTFDVIDRTDVPIDKCILHDSLRDHSVGREAIERMAATLAKSQKNGWRLTPEWMNDTSTVYTYVPPEPYTRTDLPEVVICDIDGTLALNDGHRGHYEYDKVGADKPNVAICHTLQMMAEAFPIIFLSGREDRCRKDTTDWLWKHTYFGGDDPTLYMRPTGDHRPDYIIKRELFDAHIRDRFSVFAVLDDRDQVVRLWRDMGLTCLQVADGDF